MPERYKVDSRLREILSKNGFEVGIHGLNHDGKLFKSKKIFDKRCIKINKLILLAKMQKVGDYRERTGQILVSFPACSIDLVLAKTS